MPKKKRKKKKKNPALIWSIKSSKRIALLQVSRQVDLLTQLICPHFTAARAEIWVYFWITTTSEELYLCNLLKFTLSEEFTLWVYFKAHNRL